MRLTGILAWVGLLATAALAQPGPASSQPADLQSLTREQLIELVVEMRVGRQASFRQVEEVLKRLDALSARLLASEDERVKLRQELVRLQALTAERAGGQAQLEQMRAQVESMRARGDKLAAEVADLSHKLAAVSAEREYLLRQARLQREQLDILVKRLHEAEAAPLAASQPDAPKPGIRARIAQVKGDTAVINAGQQQGVKLGMTFVVVRGATFLAELEIREVARDISMGVLVRAIGPVEPGDSAVTKLH